MSFKHIPFGTPEVFNVVVEIPEGSSNKYEYDEELDTIKLDFVFRDGFHFPFNYGYVPETRAGDGDHLDVILLNPYPIQVGTVVPARTIGMLELLDRGEEDNKLIAVPVENPEYAKYQSISDLSQEQLDDFRRFFQEIGVQKSKVMEIKNFHDRDRAIEELQKSRIQP